MEIPQDRRQHLSEIAHDTLRAFDLIAQAASDRLGISRTHNPDVFTDVNSFTANAPVRNLRAISQDVLESCRALKLEPAIARIVAETSDGTMKTYYVCRATSEPVKEVNLASYRSPVGRLASLPIGGHVNLPKDGATKVLERTQLRPALSVGQWDSLNSVLEGQCLGPLTIDSMRVLLDVAGGDNGLDFLESFLAEKEAETNVHDGLRRSVLTKMGLRDQPVLDQYQDEIFRLPLAAHLMILGPPGTGKTTTLIRRLGQKRDLVYLEPQEQQLLEDIPNQEESHADSWLMFTPTDLLKDYLKEAFSREGVPASNRRIRTWDDYRHELARVHFGLLKTSTGRGSLILNNKGKNLRQTAYEKPTHWFNDFDEWQRNSYFSQLAEAMAVLVGSHDDECLALGKRLKTVLERPQRLTIVDTFRALAGEAQFAQKVLERLKLETDRTIKSSIAVRFGKNRNLLDELAAFIDGLQDGQGVEPEDQDDVEEESAAASQTSAHAALNAYISAIRARARASVSKRSLNKNSKHARVLEWIGEDIVSSLDFKGIGESLLVQSSARRFVNPVRSYFDGVSRRYTAFRRTYQERGLWYLKDGFDSREVCPLELDLVLLATLRDGNSLVSARDIRKNIDSTFWAPLHSFVRIHRNQVLVDEATDFSPVQLACMAALARPELQSFFACGDFNQRLTTWGTRTEAELRWVYPDIDIREISVSYRQSRQLNELSRAIVEALEGTGHVATIPKHVDSEGLPPVLLELASSEEILIEWLAQRVREIEKFVGQMPSTAIFVNSEEEVTRVADALKHALYEDNIRVQACPLGQVMGQDNDVRVFDIQYIKGLEFEAVFFVDVDVLAESEPQLFDKYLYVGATRAATYLGIACRNYVPELLDDLKNHFVDSWPTTHRAHGTLQ